MFKSLKQSDNLYELPILTFNNPHLRSTSVFTGFLRILN
jgi:hypothetical protein